MSIRSNIKFLSKTNRTDTTLTNSSEARIKKRLCSIIFKTLTGIFDFNCAWTQTVFFHVQTPAEFWPQCLCYSSAFLCMHEWSFPLSIFQRIVSSKHRSTKVENLCPLCKGYHRWSQMLSDWFKHHWSVSLNHKIWILNHHLNFLNNFYT